MNWINFILILGMVLLLTYSTFSCLLIGRMPISLSETYYDLKRLKKGWYFTVTLITTAVTLLPIWLDKTEGAWYQFLVFISCACVLFVAVTPDYRKDMERKIHYVSAYLACFAVIVYHIVNGSWPILLVTLIPAVVSIFRCRTSIAFFTELGLVCSIYLSLL